MTQPLEENRLYSSWSRTPGKPSSSSNFINTKISNISSSTDSGVGRTPNWNSDTDNKFGIYDSNLWSNSNPLPSFDIIENPKKLSWDENTNKVGSNFTFGFSSQWPTNNENSPWGLPRNNSSDFIVNDSSKLDNCWNNSQSMDVSNDRFLTRNNSIWSANQTDSNNSISTTANVDNNVNGFQIVDPISKSSKHSKSILPTETDKSEFPLFSAFNSSVVNDIGTIDLNNQDGRNNDKIEHQTWAQAAGKGLQTSIKEDGIKPEVDEQFQNLINRIDGWGSHTVDQSTPWVVENEICLDSTEKIGNIPSQRNRSNVESNVWTNEPPNGVGIWESHYENLGERTSRWGTAIANQKAKPSGWEIDSTISNQWNDRDDSSVWSSGTNVTTPKPTWGMLGTIGKEEQIATTPIGTGSRSSTSSHMVSTQRNTIAPMPVISGSVPPEVTDQVNRHNNFYPNQNVNMMTNNRIAQNTKSKQMMNIGFRKEDSQTPLFNNSMDIGRSFMDMKNTSLNHSNMMASRNDWNMQHENFRVNPAEPDSNVMMGSGYIPQSMIQANNQPIKQRMMPHMPMSMGNRLPSENHILVEKQIISEITQLQSKQQDLLQRIHGLRSIAGSQAFIQEMTRTLNEVRQQLNTQQTTLKVIRSQMSMVNSQLPNGMINNNSANPLMSMVSRTMQPSAPGVPSQSQSGLVSDLSFQMNELKLQKNRMDLWSQGNLPSPSTISPYMNVDKSTGFYNPNMPNGASMPPQSFNNFNRNSQLNCISAHRQPKQQQHMWQSRMMQNTGGGGAATSTNTNAFNVNIDSHSMNNGPNINDEMDSISNNGLSNSNSANSKLQINCASDPTGNNNSTANSAITTALSLTQTLPSSIGSRVSSAFTSSRDISHISANINEFVPGQPWPGINYSQRDDPTVTLGTGPRTLLSITNDHLEKLANSNVNSLNGPNDVGYYRLFNRLPINLNGVCSGANRTSMTYVLIRDLPSHINIEMLKNALTPLSFPGLIHMHPNLASRWVLLHFSGNEDAMKAYKSLYNKVGIVELVSDQEVNQRHQYNNCAASPVIPCSGLMDFHQSQQQSHYLH